MARKFRAYIDYEDAYVQPLIIEAFRTQLPEECYILVDCALKEDPRAPNTPLLQWTSYESLDFSVALSSSTHHQHLVNAYIIRKSLIRKHYLAHTIHHYVTKHPCSALVAHFKPSVAFELDYAEFLDDALTEADAWDLTQSMERNEGLKTGDKDYWILKPGMSDRGQGIRMFSTFAELQSIFEGWEAEMPESDDDDEVDRGDDSRDDNSDGDEEPAATKLLSHDTDTDTDNINTSHLRHFLAQPYIHPPLLLPQAPYNNRKFHIRTYVVAAGALRVYVYSHMLALFASEPYIGPGQSGAMHEGDQQRSSDNEDLLRMFRDVHLTNTCVQSASAEGGGKEQEHVFLLSELPLSARLHETIVTQIHSAMAEMFRAATAQVTNFQPLPQAFEIFGVDFLIEDLDKGTQTQGGQENHVSVQLLEVNAFPDFAQTGDQLRDLVVKGLFEEVVQQIIAPYFGLQEKLTGMGRSPKHGRLVNVLDSDMHLR